MKGRIRRTTTVVASVALAALLVVPGAALAAGPGSGHGNGGGNSSGGKGGGNNPGPPDTEIGNNLSVPAIFVGSNPYGLTCSLTATPPSGDPSTGYEVNPTAYYYVQGENEWQATCLNDEASAVAVAEWGDNLAGDARLKVGSPIRVEVGLVAAPIAGSTGYTVIKLQPSLLDRNSSYGTLATLNGEGAFEPGAAESPYSETRVWTAGATLTITDSDGNALDIPSAASAEINATGRVVYGYNLRVAEQGTYTITYTFPNVEVTGVDVGEFTFDEEAGTSTVSLDITVGPGGGGGGGHR